MRNLLKIKLKKNFTQATRTEPLKRLPDSWICFTPNMATSAKTIDSARLLANDFGFDDVLIVGAKA